MADEYDVIIVGSGAGGGTLAHRLAPSGKRVLILERGDWLPREPENWDAEAVFVDNRYVSKDTWFDNEGKAFQPQIHYFVGGATKFYGAALYRLRERDFGELKHHDGISPSWPIGYDVLEPYYTQAEELYQVHGARGEDPTDHGQRQHHYPVPQLLIGAEQRRAHDVEVVQQRVEFDDLGVRTGALLLQRRLVPDDRRHEEQQLHQAEQQGTDVTVSSGQNPETQ